MTHAVNAEVQNKQHSQLALSHAAAGQGASGLGEQGHVGADCGLAAGRQFVGHCNYGSNQANTDLPMAHNLHADVSTASAKIYARSAGLSWGM